MQLRLKGQFVNKRDIQISPLTMADVLGVVKTSIRTIAVKVGTVNQL